MTRGELLRRAAGLAAGAALLRVDTPARAAGLPARPTLAVWNRTSNVQPGEVDTVIAACQKQVDRDFAPLWGRSCLLHNGRPWSPSQWVIELLDYADDPGALGYHYLEPGGKPVGRVFVEESLGSGVPWSVVLSHELLEVLGDPQAAVYQVVRDTDPVRLYALETADPVENDWYTVDGVTVSDFVTPRWFMPKARGGRFDFLGLCSGPLQLRRGGYQIVLEGGEWYTLPRRRTPPGGPMRRRRRPTRGGYSPRSRFP